MSLKAEVVLRFAIVLVVFGALLFVPAGSFRYWQGWTYLCVSTIPALLTFAYFFKHDPEVVKRRVRSKEKIPAQKLIMRFLVVTYAAAFLIPGLDYRFRWSHPPLWLIILSLVALLLSSLLTFRVLKTNRFASRAIQVEAGQTVVCDGPYRVVRHPMYSGICAMLLFTPLALGSYVALPAFCLVIPLVVLRLLNEEKVLRRELPGYPEYCLRTRYRLVPLVW